MSSKYSQKEKISRKLESVLEEFAVGIPASDKDDLTPEEVARLPQDVFEAAAYDEKGAERGGYSNYSYWRSTIRMFFKNKMAVAMLAIMLTLLIFTFIQPLLPEQKDPNTVNYYDANAVWITVEEDAKMKVEGVKYTKGDYAVLTNGEGLLAYVRVPESWGVPAAFARAKGAGEEEAAKLTLTMDAKNKGWYYMVVPKKTPHVVIKSEDGAYTTFHKAVWIVVGGENNGVGSGSTKLTSGELIADVPENTVLAYINVPADWGVPQISASATMRGEDPSDVEIMADPENEGWYYAFAPAGKPMLKLTSADGTISGANRGVAHVTDPQEIKLQVGFVENKRPSAAFWFGTNNIGQDLWARMWSGSRTSLLIGLVVAGIQAAIGIVTGLIWGYVRKLDFLFTELYNIINNIPTTIILILASYIMRPSVQTLIIAMVVTGWIGLARFIRNLTIIVRDRDFNLASRCLGTPTRKIIAKNLLPQMVSVVMLRMALAIPAAIGSEVFLAYIGLGLPVSIPSLGNLVNNGRTLMMASTLRYQLIIPAVILSVITICFYLVGNAFADAADPKNHV